MDTRATAIVFLPLVAASLLTISAGCSPASSEAAVDVQFPLAYSAFDGTHTFQVPITVTGLHGVEWSLSDPSVATMMAGTVAGQQLLTIKKAGTVEYVAKAGGLSGSGKLTVTAATTDDWTIGQQRYNNGVKYWPPRTMMATTSATTGTNGTSTSGTPATGVPGTPTGMRPMPNHDAACTSCHGADAAGGPFKDVEHTPTQAAGYSDQELITIFTMGKKPDGATYRIVTPERYAVLHHWDMSLEEAKGIVVYLRSLAPKTQGPIDFGGHGWRGNAGGM